MKPGKSSQDTTVGRENLQGEIPDKVWVIQMTIQNALIKQGINLAFYRWKVDPVRLMAQS